MNEVDDMSAIETSIVTNDVTIEQNPVVVADAAMSDIVGMNTDTVPSTDNIGAGIEESVRCAVLDGISTIESVDAVAISGEVGATGDGDNPMQDPEAGNPGSFDGDVHDSDASKPSSGSRMKHFYCPVCGHTWYSPDWPSYCPKSGCFGRPQEM